MLHSLKARRENEEGFTLIELMVVVLIIAILLAIAIPTFLGARSRAQDRAAQSNLRNALTAEKTFYTDNQTYTDNAAVPAALTAIEPSLTYQAGYAVAASTKGDVFVTVGDVVAGDKQVVCLTVKSASGSLFAIDDISTGADAGTYYFKAAQTACTNASAKLGVKTGF
jgi:type IV pilus assembly protein PilA